MDEKLSEEEKAIFSDYINRATIAIHYNRMAEAAKHLTGLLEYACGKSHRMNAYIKVLDKIISDIIKEKPDHRIASFAKSFNYSLAKLRSDYEGYFNVEDVLESIDKVEKFKMERLGKYIAPPEEAIRKAEKYKALLE